MEILINYADSKYIRTQKFNCWTGKYIGRFKKVIAYSDKDIDQDYKMLHKDIFLESRGNGLWLWKPYIIKKSLDMIKDGDIIFYCDSGAYFIRNIKKILNTMGNEGIWVSELPLLEYQFTKKETVMRMNCFEERYYKSNQISASFIGVKKTKQSVEFINEWLRLCEDKSILFPANTNDEFENNINHREDQSVLSLLCKKYNIKPHNDPSQFGRFPEKYERPNYVLNIVNRNDTYKTCIVHHRTPDANLKVCFNQFLYAVLPKGLLRLIKQCVM